MRIFFFFFFFFFFFNLAIPNGAAILGRVASHALVFGDAAGLQPPAMATFHAGCGRCILFGIAWVSRHRNQASGSEKQGG